MLCFDVWENSYGRLKSLTSRDQGNCACCQLRRFEFGEAGSALATTLCGRDSVQISVREGSRLNLRDLAQRLKAGGKVQINEFLLRFTVDQFEIAVFPDGRGIVRGTKDAKVAVHCTPGMWAFESEDRGGRIEDSTVRRGTSLAILDLQSSIPSNGPYETNWKVEFWARPEPWGSVLFSCSKNIHGLKSPTSQRPIGRPESPISRPASGKSPAICRSMSGI